MLGRVANGVVVAVAVVLGDTGTIARRRMRIGAVAVAGELEGELLDVGELAAVGWVTGIGGGAAKSGCWSLAGAAGAEVGIFVGGGSAT